MTGDFSAQVKMNVKLIGVFKSGLIRQVVLNAGVLTQKALRSGEGYIRVTNGVMTHERT